VKKEVVTPILQMRKLRSRAASFLAQRSPGAIWPFRFPLRPLLLPSAWLVLHRVPLHLWNSMLVLRNENSVALFYLFSWLWNPFFQGESIKELWEGVIPMRVDSLCWVV
jgi:hypothetical protein